MEIEQVKAQLLPILKKHYIPLGLGFLGLIFLGYGLISLLGSRQSASENVVFEGGGNNEGSISQKSISVDVEGAVVKAGVYKLAADARIQEALIAAGGLASTADRNWVSKSLNLAARLTDGAKIYIPETGESVPAVNNTLGLININSASEQELDTLPGIGPVTAQKIIGARPYNSINELLDKKIVGSKVFSQIKDKISAN